MGARDVGVFDHRLQHPFSLIVSGPSNSGKTYFVKMLIENVEKCISQKIDNIVYIYSCWQPLYDELLKLRDVKFVEGLPLSLCDDSLLPIHKNNLLIIDDLMNDASNNVEVQNVFTKYVHHRNLSCLYLVQNLFFQGKASRTINLNTNYLVLFKNPRDKYQVMLMAKQMFPGKSKFFMECFENATSVPYGYLLIDYKARTPDDLRLRTDLLSDAPVVYVPKNK
ncbi:hypothetical protein PAMP_001045 [Pampus punctatissimus]